MKGETVTDPRDVTERTTVTSGASGLRFLAAVNDALDASQDGEQTLRTIAQLIVPALADVCAIDLRATDGSTTRLIRVPGTGAPDQGRLDDATETAIAEALRTGVPQLWPAKPGTAPAGGQADGAATAPTPLRARSLIVAPLVAGGRTLGAFTLVRTGSRPAFTEDDLVLARELARRGALAIGHARLVAAKQEARRDAERAVERTVRLQALTAALSSALTPAQVVAVMIERGFSELGARGTVVAQVADGPAILEVLGATSYVDPQDMQHQHIPLTADGPLAEVARTGVPVFLETRAAMECRYPTIASHAIFGTDQALVALPLIVEGRILGAVALSFATPRSFASDEQSFLLAVAQQCAQSLDRTRLYRREQETRQRQALLVEASAVLTSSLDYEQTLATVAELAVPQFADWCIVHILDDNGRFQHLAVAHPDPDRRRRVQEAYWHHLPAFSEPHPVAEVLRTGEAQLCERVDEAVWRAIASDADHLSVIQTIAPRSGITAPLIARGRRLGVITFIHTQSGRSYDLDDLEVARELSQRAATSIDNAQLYQESQAAVRAREAFLSTAAHELKTPLTTIKGYGQLLLRFLNQPTLDREHLLRMAGQLQRQTDRFEALVNDLLDVSRIQQGRVALRPQAIDLASLVAEVVARFEQSHERTLRHQLILEARSVRGWFDPIRLDMVLTNLLSNALKFSPAGGEVRITVGPGDGGAELRVSDQGIGIPIEEQAHLFDPFMRGEQVWPQMGGTGLGLFITGQIVEQHHGTIEIESAPGKGSTFIIRLPLEPSSPASD